MTEKDLPLKHNSSQRTDKIDEWFANFIAYLNVDKFLLKSDIASKETTDFYNSMMSGNETWVVSKLRRESTQYFIQKLIFDYIKELTKINTQPLKLAVGISDSKILVWSEINDDDEATEDALLLAEATVNSKYYPHGFFINSTIVEKSDKQQIPPHYFNLTLSPKK